jgi:hypothetical protein
MVTFAGDPSVAPANNDPGIGTSAHFNNPTGIDVDHVGAFAYVFGGPMSGADPSMHKFRLFIFKFRPHKPYVGRARSPRSATRTAVTLTG